MKKQRIKWIDVARFIGIFAIVLVHLGPASGRSYDFIRIFVIELFFFLSGCADNFDKRNIKGYILHKIKTLVIPFFIFGFLLVICNTIRINGDGLYFGKQILNLLNGFLKNTGIGGLWFISCAFIMCLLFKLIRTLIKRKWLLLVVCFVISFASMFIFKSHFFWNTDLALKYLFLYCLGYVTFEKINTLLIPSKKNNIILLVMFILLFAFALYCYNDIENIWYFIKSNTYILVLYKSFLRPILLIAFVIIISHYFEDYNILRNVGQCSLFICCSEYIVRYVFDAFFKLLSININLENNRIGAYIYAIMMTVFIFKILYPYEQILLARIYKSLKLD